MLSFTDSAISCGVDQMFDLYDIDTKAQFLKSISEYYSSAPFLIFSDAVEEGRECNEWGEPDEGFDKIQDSKGEFIYNLIKENDWGTIHRTRARLNPNSGNKIRVYIWAPNEKVMKAARNQR